MQEGKNKTYISLELVIFVRYENYELYSDFNLYNYCAKRVTLLCNYALLIQGFA